MKRSIGVVTGSRAEYGILRPLLEAIRNSRDLALRLYVTGAHLSPRFGSTVREIEKDGFPISEKVPILSAGALSPSAVAAAFSRAVSGFSKVFEKKSPDLLLLLGDRYEMLAAGVAAMLHQVVIAHVSGGKTTQGSMDESIRHSLTKLSHYHFTHAEEYRRRIIRMGEAPSRVFAYGSPLVDGIADLNPMSLEELRRQKGLETLEAGALVVLYHPETLETSSPEAQIAEVLEGLAGVERQKVFFYPNADVGSAAVIAALERWARGRGDALLVKNLSRRAFLSVLKLSGALAGNSSCGVTDTPTLGVPAVNVGDRQKGMVKARNILDCPCRAAAIRAALKRALSRAFRRSCAGLKNPYGDGRSVARIARKLGELPLDGAVLKKVFHD